MRRYPNSLERLAARIGHTLELRDPATFCRNPHIRCDRCEAVLVEGGTIVRYSRCFSCERIHGPMAQER